MWEAACLALQPDTECPLISTMSGGNRDHQPPSTSVENDFKAVLNTVPKVADRIQYQEARFLNPASTTTCTLTKPWPVSLKAGNNAEIEPWL